MAETIYRITFVNAIPKNKNSDMPVFKASKYLRVLIPKTRKGRDLVLIDGVAQYFERHLPVTAMKHLVTLNETRPTNLKMKIEVVENPGSARSGSNGGSKRPDRSTRQQRAEDSIDIETLKAQIREELIKENAEREEAERKARRNERDRARRAEKNGLTNEQGELVLDSDDNANE